MGQGLAAKVRIDIDGTEVKDFVEFKVHQTIYKPNEFEIRFRSETFESSDLSLMETSKSNLGKTINIEIEKYADGYKSSKPAFFFKGLITDIKAARSGMLENDLIILSGFSPDILLCGSPGCLSFERNSLKTITEKVLNAIPKNIIRSKIAPVNHETFNYIVQYRESAYDFLRRLARRFGEWFYYDGSELIMGAPPSDQVSLKLGHELSDFALSIRTRPLWMRFTAFNESTGQKEISSQGIKGSTGKDQLNNYGVMAFNESAIMYSVEGFQQNVGITSPETGYKAELDRSAKLTAEAGAVNMQVVTAKSEDPTLKLCGKVKVESERGADFGEYRINSITHYCDNMRSYRNEFSCMPGKSNVPDYSDPLECPRCEPQTAIVTNNKDPEKLGRIKIRFLWQPDNLESPWIRVMYPHAGQDAGFYFLPEVNAEVMVGFESDDAEKPYIMGSLHHWKQTPAKSWYSDTNDIKAIRTRSGNTIELIDKQGGEEIIIYQGKDKANAHHISMVSGGDPVLNIFSKGKLVLEAKSIEIKTSTGSIDITSNQNVTVNGKANVTMEGLNVDAKAQSQMNVKGITVNVEATAKLKNSGGAMVEIQGGIVKIN